MMTAKVRIFFKPTDAILLDLSKSFDRVQHECLFLNLNRQGIDNFFFDSGLDNFLSNRTQRVVIRGKSSD